MQIDLDRFTGLLKVRYQDPFFNQVVGFSNVFDLFKLNSKVKQGPIGKYTESSNLFGAIESNGFRSQNGNLPIPGSPTFVNSRTGLKTQFHTVQINRQAMAQAVKGPAAFADWTEVTLKPSAKVANWELDRTCIGFGSGAICRIDGASATNTLPIDAPYGLPSNEKGWLPGIRRGKRLVSAQFIDGTGLRTGGKSLMVLSVDKSGNAGGGVITFDQNVPADWADNDYLFTGDDLGTNAPELGVEVEPIGLLGHVDDGTVMPTHQNVDRSLYPEWKAQMIDASVTYGSNASELLFMRGYADAMELGGGDPDVLISTFAVFRNAFKELLRTAANTNANVQRTTTGDPTGGANKLRFKIPFGNGMLELRAFPKMPPGRAFMLDSSTMMRHHLKNGAFEWVDWTGSMFHQVQVGQAIKDAVWIYGRNEIEFSCTSPQQNVQFYNLSETVA